MSYTRSSDPYRAWFVPFTVYRVVDGGLVEYLTVTGDSVVNEVAVSEHDLAGQLEKISTQIAWFSRLYGQTERVHAFTARQYAVYKAKRYVEIQKGKDGEKPPPANAIDRIIRTEPGYGVAATAMEEAGEAMTSCKGIVDALKAKKEIMIREFFRANDESLKRVLG